MTEKIPLLGYEIVCKALRGHKKPITVEQLAVGCWVLGAVLAPSRVVLDTHPR